MSTEQFLLPDVGEGLTEAEIVTWNVAVGDSVSVNQSIVEIETAKSLVDLPSPYAGTVVELLAAVGDTVDVGKPIISIQTSSDAPTAGSPDRAGQPNGADAADEPKLLVGYGPRAARSGRRRRGGRADAADLDIAQAPVRAKPPVRKLASVLGVDLAAVTPTGRDGTVVRADVLEHAPSSVSGSVGAVRPAAYASVEGEVTRYPIKGVRKATAAAMVASAFTAPHVTEFISVDVTETLLLKDHIQARREFREIKLTPLAFIARAYLAAIKRTPMANARWEENSQEIVVPTAVNLGIAAATPRGLVVPNIENAHTMGIRELAEAISALATTARAGNTRPEEMVGGTTTITNVGVFGIDTATPILNPGETAILAVGTIKKMPAVVETADGERIMARPILQLALSFDHRVMDGQQGSELLADTAAMLNDPGLVTL